ncbi:MAG: hypothetical protein JWM41_1667 [Gemmatimonadetes bacterium]|nr:hypothetical protein [Gemmatimonadota bacterium]
MMHHTQFGARMRRRMRGVAFAAICGALAACSHGNQPNDDFDPRPGPIPIHVKNENFLDMNIAVVAGGTTRRLGQVSGNSTGDFTVNWSIGNGGGIIVTATPIGGSGQARSPALNVAPGQMIDFRVASLLRQSVATVHDP